MTRSLALVLVIATAGLATADVAPEPRPPAPRGEAAGAVAHVATRPPPRPTPPPAPPAPSPEIARLGKQVGGSYKCKGVSLRGDGSSTPLVATVTIKLDLDNAWIRSSLAEDKGIKFDEYRTYDATAKQWTRIQMASTSGHVISTSLGEKDGKWTWDGTATSPQGTMQTRDYEELGAKQIKVWGEAMLSGSWQKLYEATCKK